SIMTDSRRHLLAFLRFIAVFTILVLLINPKMSTETVHLEKRKLLVVSDNSSSLQYSETDTAVRDWIKKLDLPAIIDRFDLRYYRFAKQLQAGDSLSFSEPVTDINRALRELNDVYAQDESVLLLLTDGNQTFGADYEYFGAGAKFPVYPVVFGDTMKYEDLRIDQVNLNRYAFLKNQFPVETFVSYQGKGRVNTLYSIYLDDKKVYSEELLFSEQEDTKRINTLLEAERVGVKGLRVSLSVLPQERNVENNSRNASIEVLDEQTKIALVSDIAHPDIGVLKKAIEANEQRVVSVLKPLGSDKEWTEYDLFILYQPNSRFQNMYSYLKNNGVNRFTITGTKTDWGFLNAVQNTFEKDFSDLSDEVLPIINSGFSAFDIGQIDFDSYPPLESSLGEILITKPQDIILEQRIRGVNLGEPLFAVIQEETNREAVLFGENIWKWRIQSYRNNQNFELFDEFLGKVIRYLSGNRSKTRLSLDYEKTIRGLEKARIRAAYFDQAFQFDGNAEIALTVRSGSNGSTTERNMLLKQGYYEVDLSDLNPGEYTFTVEVRNEKLSKSGTFTILDYDVERQFLSSDYQKLARLSDRTGGELFFPNQLDALIAELTGQNAYAPKQRSEQKVVSLVDFKILLLTIVLALALEWFLRKYHGLI
ncbi:MAG: VWA domain-containing protein, partial [Eudoraea sp.]|nr:VWA domain-containing protein [Eudoraea sp.]NNJ40228.1 VWA domain-containing protein [Eudoraea sp.]